MRIFTYKGIPIILHSSFLVLASLFVIYSGVVHGPIIAMMSTVVGILLFGSVLLHELGHALAAKHYNIDTHSIVLLPIGGMALISKEPSTPKAEFMISVAGPAVNLAIFAVTICLSYLGVPLALELAFLNLVMFLFNLIPAFPMDGGRVLRAALSLKYGKVEATYISLKISTVFAWLFLLAGLFWTQYGLALVGAFLIYMTTKHRKYLDEKTAHQPRDLNWWE